MWNYILRGFLGRDGVIGSRAGLKILWSVMTVRVRAPLSVQFLDIPRGSLYTTPPSNGDFCGFYMACCAALAHTQTTGVARTFLWKDGRVGLRHLITNQAHLQGCRGFESLSFRYRPCSPLLGCCVSMMTYGFLHRGVEQLVAR